jgi:hypothetical protein
MPFVGVRVDQEVIDVDDHILEVPEYSFHSALKGCWAAQ